MGPPYGAHRTFASRPAIIGVSLAGDGDVVLRSVWCADQRFVDGVDLSTFNAMGFAQRRRDCC